MGFQNDANITLTVTSGSLNSSNALLSMGDDKGLLTFTNNNTATFTVAYYDPVIVSIDNVRLTASGEARTITASNVRVEWWVLVEPWLPFMFILGMIGVCSMFAGPLYTIHLMKKGDYRQAFTQGTIFLALGFGLVLAWLWGGA